jgi:hypothetical protein
VAPALAFDVKTVRLQDAANSGCRQNAQFTQ